MKNQIEKSILQKAKELLMIEEDLSSFELFKKLRDYRSSFHPDKFQDKITKNEATEKFQQINNIIEELAKYIEKEKIILKSKELLIYEPQAEKVTLQVNLDSANEKMKELEENVDLYRNINRRLELTITELENEKLKTENEELKEFYKPSSKKFFSFSILFLFTSALAICNKIEEFSVVFRKYSPISENVLDGIISVVFLFIFLTIFKQFIESNFLAQKTNEVHSPKFCKEFLKHLQLTQYWSKGEPTKFSEEEIFTFIHGKENRLTKFLSRIGFRLYQIETSDRLKDIFINTLLNKKLISISKAKNLDRTFKIYDDTRRADHLF